MTAMTTNERARDQMIIGRMTPNPQFNTMQKPFQNQKLTVANQHTLFQQSQQQTTNYSTHISFGHYHLLYFLRTTTKYIHY